MNGNRSGVYRCPRCSIVRTMLVHTGAMVVTIDTSRQRVICPAEGADMEPISEADLRVFGLCAADGHEVEAWKGSCSCGTVKA